MGARCYAQVISTTCLLIPAHMRYSKIQCVYKCPRVCVSKKINFCIRLRVAFQESSPLRRRLEAAISKYGKDIDREVVSRRAKKEETLSPGGE